MAYPKSFYCFKIKFVVVFNLLIIVKLLLCKYKITADKEYVPVYFNSATKAVISSDKYDLHKSFKEILCRINNWINEGCGWIISLCEYFYL